MQKHTPGPYHVNAIAGNRVIGDETCTTGVDKYQVCNANATVATVYRPRDAALLKSAPDMLATLQIIYANAAESPEWIRARIASVIAKATSSEEQ